MSNDQVRAEVSSVRALKQGVGRYAEHVRDAIADARREMAAADRKAQESVDRRRSEVHKCEQKLRHLEAALRQCRDNCGGLQQQVADAAQRLAIAQQLLERARKAARVTAAAQSELAKALQTTETTVGEHSSVASSALASLDAKLASLPQFGVGHAIHNIAAGTVVGVEIFGATMDLGRVAGNALQAVNVSTPLRDHTVTEMVEHRQEQERQHVIERDFESRKRTSSGEGKETNA